MTKTTQLIRQLSDRRGWAKVCAETRKRDGTTCRCCRRNVPVSVHCFAEDIDVKHCVLLCDPCHGQLKQGLATFRRFVFSKLTPRAIEVLNGALAVGLDHNEPLTLAHAIAELCASPSSVQRFAEAWR
jgi:hypothetical protein